MSAISTYLEYIRSKVYAKDVRTAIVNAISQCYDDVNKPALQTEAMQAAVQAKIDAGQMAALTIADGSLTGAKLADGAVTANKIANGAVTTNKIADLKSALASVEKLTLGRNFIALTPKTYTSASVTFVSDEANVTANGTATNNAICPCYSFSPAISGNYKISGCPAGGAISRFYVCVNTLNTPQYTDFGNGATVPLIAGEIYKLWIVVAAGYSATDLTFTPSIIFEDALLPTVNSEMIDNLQANINKAAYANIAIFDAATYPSAGVVFTSDGVKVTANGTATSNAICQLIKFTPLYTGKYRIGGCPADGGLLKYYVCVNTLNTPQYTDFGRGATVNLNAGVEYILWLVVSREYTADNLEFNPYVYYADFLDSEIKTFGFKTETVVLPSYYDSYMPNKIATIKDNIDSVGRDGETFVFITDIHWEQNYKQSPLLVKYILERANVRLMLCGGDLINTQQKAVAKDLIYAVVKNFDVPDIPMHMIMGNHDTNSLNWSSAALRAENEFTAKDVFGLTQKNTSYSNNYVGDLNNYYFDRPDSKTRFIILQTGIWDGGYTQETITALYDMLMSTPENYKIIIAEHWFFGGATAETETEITQAANMLMGMVKQFNTRGAYDTHDFSSARGEVCLILSGHTHFDYSLAVDDSRNISGVPVVATNCDSFRSNADAVKGTITEQCFDVVTMDYTNRQIKFVRIGRGENRVVNY